MHQNQILLKSNVTNVDI